MQNTLRILFSLFLFIILTAGVAGYYYQIHSKSGITSISRFSDEEDLHKEDFIKNVISEDLNNECVFVTMTQNILLPHLPSCILEGHTGLVTPPPWL